MNFSLGQSKFDRFPPRTLIHGRSNDSDEAVHIYLDDSGDINAAYYTEGGLITSHDNSRFNPKFLLKDHIPNTIHPSIGDFSFIKKAQEAGLVKKLDDFNFWKSFTKSDYESALADRNTKTILGPVMRPVFSSRLNVAGESILMNGDIEISGHMMPVESIKKIAHMFAADIFTDYLNEWPEFGEYVMSDAMLNFSTEMLKLTVMDFDTNRTAQEKVSAVHAKLVEGANVYIGELDKYFSPAPEHKMKM